MAIWAPDAKLIAGRSATPDKYDSERTRPQIEAVGRLKYASGLPAPKDVKFDFDNVHVDVAGNMAVLRYRSILKQDGAAGISDEIYKLRKVEGKWQVYENRFWPVEIRSADRIIKYSAATWERLDAAVDKQKQDKDMLGETIALLQAWRPQEAHAWPGS